MPSMYIQEDLDVLTALASKRDLVINSDQCEIIHFGPNNPDLEYDINKSVVPKTEFIRDLGLLVDRGLTFVKHTNAVRAKCFFSCIIFLKYFIVIPLKFIYNFTINTLFPLLTTVGFFIFLILKLTAPLLKRFNDILQRNSSREYFRVVNLSIMPIVYDCFK